MRDRFADGISPTLTEGAEGGGRAPLGSLSSMRSRTFLENAINWRPIVKKYRQLTSTLETEERANDMGAGGGGGAAHEGEGGAEGGGRGDGAPGTAKSRRGSFLPPEQRNRRASLYPGTDRG